MVLVLLSAGWVGCQAQVDASLVQAKVVAFGAFDLREGRPTLASPSTRIPCVQGNIFGVDYRIEVPEGQSGTVPVDFRWVHPELAVPSLRLWGPETPAGASSPKLKRGQAALAGRALWALEHVDEMVSGRYEFQIRRLDNGEVILSQPFEVEGC